MDRKSIETLGRQSERERKANADTQPIRTDKVLERETIVLSRGEPEKKTEKKPEKREKNHIFLRGKTDYFDYNLLLITIFLIAFGLIMLYSTSAYSAQADFGNDMNYFIRQTVYTALSFLVLWAVSRMDYHFFGRISFLLYLIAMVLMALVRTPLGQEIYGARRWLQLPFNLSMQPSEVTKVAVILFISYELCRLGTRISTARGVVRILAFGAIAAAGVYFFTDNLSTAIIVMAITCILLFVAHPLWKPFIAILAAVGMALGVFLMYLPTLMANSDSFRLQRIAYWLDPESGAESGSYQVLQGLYAIGSGGFFGKGLGNSTQKLGVIPEVQNDMILSIICEELGVFGAIILLAMFAFLLYRLMFIARNAPDLFGSLVATGIFAHIALQVILNIAVVTNLIPTTGITLPFISYGGTSIFFLMFEMGLALGISRTIKLDDKKT